MKSSLSHLPYRETSDCFSLRRGRLRDCKHSPICDAYAMAFV